MVEINPQELEFDQAIAQATPASVPTNPLNAAAPAPATQAAPTVQPETKAEPEVSYVDIVNPDGKQGKMPEPLVAGALKKGYTLPKPGLEEDKVRVKTIKDGKVTFGFLPKDMVDAAVASGKYFPLNEKDKAAAPNLDYLHEEGILGFGLPASLDVGIMGVAKQLPIVDSYLEKQLASNPAKEYALKLYTDEHSTADTLGQILGFGGTIYATGGLGELAVASKALRTLSTGTKLAIKGSIWGAPEAVEDAIKGDYVGAAESLALGIGSEVGLHHAGKALSKVKGKLAERAAEAAPAKFAAAEAKAATAKEAADALAAKEFTTAQNTFAKELGITDPKKIKLLNDKYENVIKYAGLTGKDSKDSAAKKILKMAEDSDKEILNTVKKLDEVANKGEMITNALFKTSDDLTRLTENLVSVEKKEAERALKPILQQINDVSKLSDLTFEQTQVLKKFIEKKSNKDIVKTAYNILEQNLQVAENKAASLLSDPSVVDNLQKHRLTNSIKDLINDFGSKLDKETVKKPFEKLTDLIPKGDKGGLTEGILLDWALSAMGVPHGVGFGIKTGINYFKQAAESKKFGQAVSILSKESTTPGADAVLASNKLLNDELVIKAKDLFGNISGKSGKYIAPAAARGLNSWLVDGGHGKSKRAQIDELKDMAAMHRVNPEMVRQHLANVTQPLRDEGLDQVADQYTNHQLRLMKVIDTILPNNPKMDVAHPFAAEVKKQDLSPTAVAQYEKALTLAADPTHLFELIKNNTISQRDIAIVAATNPQTYQKMKNELLKESIKNKPDLTYQQRLSLGIFMGENIDKSTQMVPQLQSVYAAQPAGGQPSTGAPKLSAKAVDNINDSVKSGSQQSSLQ